MRTAAAARAMIGAAERKDTREIAKAQAAMDAAGAEEDRLVDKINAFCQSR